MSKEFPNEETDLKSFDQGTVLRMAVERIDHLENRKAVWDRLTVLLRLKMSYTPGRPSMFIKAEDGVEAARTDQPGIKNDTLEGSTRYARREVLRLMLVDPETRPLISDLGLPAIIASSGEKRAWLIYNKSRHLAKQLYTSKVASPLMADNPQFLHILKRVGQGYSFLDLDHEFSLNLKRWTLKEFNKDIANFILNGHKRKSFSGFCRKIVFSNICQEESNWFHQPIGPMISEAAKTILSISPIDTTEHGYWQCLRAFVERLPIIHHALTKSPEYKGRAISIPDDLYKQAGNPYTIDLEKYLNHTVDGIFTMSSPIEFVCRTAIEGQALAKTGGILDNIRVPIAAGTLRVTLDAGQRMIENVGLMKSQKNHNPNHMRKELLKSRYKSVHELESFIAETQRYNGF